MCSVKKDIAMVQNLSVQPKINLFKEFIFMNFPELKGRLLGPEQQIHIG
jgi:hypothetical protein